MRMDRFWSLVDRRGDDECWPWLGSRSATGGRAGTGGYGKYGKSAYAHRVAYEALVGPIPGGLQLDHLCMNPPCVNPRHLEPVTPKENLRRWKLTYTHCKNGHEFTPENTIVYRRNGGEYRNCRECHNATMRRVRQRRRDAA